MLQNLRIHIADAPVEMERLAQQLVQRLGVQDALRFCRDNHWDGVKNLIQQSLRRNPD